MAVTGAKFTSIPSGVLNAAWNGTRLEAAFKMHAKFTSDDGDYASGEYRQLVMGEFRCNGVVVPHVLCGSTYLSNSIAREDGCPPPGCTAYGYRACQTAKNYYKPTQAGPEFCGADEPGIRGNVGDVLEMHLFFTGRLIDTASGVTFAQAQWEVWGRHVVEEVMLASAVPVRLTAGLLSAVARPDPAGAGWDVHVALARPGGQPPLAAKDVVVRAFGPSGESLTPVAGPKDNLVEVGNHRSVTAVARYRFDSSGPRPQRVSVRVGEEEATLDLGERQAGS